MESYGKGVKVPSPLDAGFEQFANLARHFLVIPSSRATIIMLRQILLPQLLVSLTDKILLEGAGFGSTIVPSSSSCAEPIRRQAPPIEERPSERSLADLIVRAEERKQNVEDGLNLLCTEPHVLKSVVYTHFYLRPELLGYAGGTKLFLEHTDKYISDAVLEVIHGAVQETANWDYIYRLLKYLQDNPKDKAYQSIISQELSNVCHYEYNRVKANFKRIFQAETGVELFSRQSGMLDKAGNALVKMKCNLVKLAEKDPYLHCLMYLCLPQTTCTGAIEWVKKLVVNIPDRPDGRESTLGLEGECAGRSYGYHNIG